MTSTTLIFASNNQHKANELRAALKNILQIKTLKEAGILIEIPEPHDSLEANASEKSKTILSITNQNCFSEDTGLEVEALEGEPGVKSARYADNEPAYKDNIDKLLHNLKSVENTSARFRTVISLQLDGKEYFFEGICNGRIIGERRGDSGFGYDPVFVPDGAQKTFAEMSMEEKNFYSHRKKAADALVQFLNNYYGKS